MRAPKFASVHTFRNVCRMSAVSRYCDGFFRDEFLRRNDLADPMPWVSVWDVSNEVAISAVTFATTHRPAAVSAVPQTRAGVRVLVMGRRTPGQLDRDPISRQG
jgi:hypothetical protein